MENKKEIKEYLFGKNYDGETSAFIYSVIGNDDSDNINDIKVRIAKRIITLNNEIYINAIGSVDNSKKDALMDLYLNSTLFSDPSILVNNIIRQLVFSSSIRTMNTNEVFTYFMFLDRLISDESIIFIMDAIELKELPEDLSTIIRGIVLEFKLRAIVGFNRLLVDSLGSGDIVKDEIVGILIKQLKEFDSNAYILSTYSDKIVLDGDNKDLLQSLLDLYSRSDRSTDFENVYRSLVIARILGELSYNNISMYINDKISEALK